MKTSVETLELKIKNALLKFVKEDFNQKIVQFCEIENKLKQEVEFREIDNQHLKNVLSKMIKERSLFRIKKDIYAFPKSSFFDLMEKLNKNHPSVIQNLYYDYLKENSNAIPVNNNIYLSKDFFSEVSEIEKDIFLNKFKNLKELNLEKALESKQEVFVLKIILFFKDFKFTTDEMIPYIEKQNQALKITQTFLSDFLDCNLQKIIASKNKRKQIEKDLFKLLIKEKN